MNLLKFFVSLSTIVLLVDNAVYGKKNNGLAEYLRAIKVRHGKTYHGTSDISESCKDSLYLKSFLPFHTGISDSDIRYLAATSDDNMPYYDCHIQYNTPSDPENVGIIVVIEFTDSEPHKPHICEDSNNEVILTSHSEYTNVCKNMTLQKLKRTNVFSKFVPEQSITLHLKLSAFYENVKITATSGKVLTSLSSVECDTSLEVTCDVSEKTFCIDKELQCDDNINCGSSTMFDEDHRLCEGDKYKRLWAIVLYSVIILIIGGFFIINILYTCVPHVADNFFIFNEHEDNRLIVVSKSVTPRQNKKVIQETSLFIDTRKRTGRRSITSLVSNSSVFTFSSEWSSSDRSNGHKKNKSVETQKHKAPQKAAATQNSRFRNKSHASLKISTTESKKKTEFEEPENKNAKKSADIADTTINQTNKKEPVLLTPTHMTEKDIPKVVEAERPTPGQETQRNKDKGLFVARDPSRLEHKTFNPQQHAANKTKTDPFKIPVREFSGYVGTAKQPPPKAKPHKTQSTMWKQKSIEQ